VTGMRRKLRHISIPFLLACVLIGGRAAEASLGDLATAKGAWTARFPQPAVREVKIDEDWFDYGTLSLTLRLSSPPPDPVRTMVYLVNGNGWYYRAMGTMRLVDDRPHRFQFDITPQSRQWLPAGHLRPWDGYVTWRIEALGLKAFCDQPWRGSIQIDNVELTPAEASGSRAKARSRIVGFSIRPSPAKTDQVVEITFRLLDGHRNPFDPDEADVEAQFRTPSGQVETVPAFFYQDFAETVRAGKARLIPVGPSTWKVRYCPREAGTYRYRIQVAGRWKLLSAQQQFSAQETSAPPKPNATRLTNEEIEDFLYDGKTSPGGQHYVLRGDHWAYEPGIEPPPKSPAWRVPIEWNAAWGGFYGPGRYGLQEAWRLDRAISKAQQAGLSYPLAFADREELYPQRKYNWLVHPLNQTQGGPLSSPSEYFRHPRTAGQVAVRARYAIARWGASPAVSQLLMRNDVPADAANTWCAAVAKGLGKMPPPQKPVLSAHPQSLPITGKRMLADFEKRSGLWPPDAQLSPGVSVRLAARPTSHGRGSLQIDGPLPGELAVVAQPDASLWGYDLLSFDLFVPESAPNDLRPMVYLKDGDWWWYETLLDPFVRPGDWTRFIVDMSDLSAQWQPVGHGRSWNAYLLGHVRMIGLRIFGHRRYNGPLYIDNVRLWKSGRQAYLDAQPLHITQLSTNTDRVPTYSLFEVTFGLSKTFENPFDPEQADVVGQFTSPSGRVITMPAFFYLGYTRQKRPPQGADAAELLVPEGEPMWKLRFTPTERGPYRYRILVRGRDRMEDVERQFEAVQSASPGFVRLSQKDRQYFEFDNGDFYYPIGHNVRSPGDDRQPYAYDFKVRKQLGTYLYDDYFKRMGEAGENWSRVWLAPWWCGLEWNSRWGGFHGVGRYNMENAWRLDYVLSLAEQYGLYLQLVTMNHGRLSLDIDSDWRYNPMNSANGGWLTPDKNANGDIVRQGAYKFYIDERARKATRNRLRYIIARWAYSTHVLQWEMSSEVEFTDPYWALTQKKQAAPTVREWHAAMADYIRQIDPWAHVLTTHFAHAWRGKEIWPLKEMEVVQTNAYTAFNELNRPPRGLSSVINTFYYTYTKKYDKPTLVAEYGVKWDKAQLGQLDAELHNGPWIMWTTPLSGATGFWWWPHVHFKDRYSHFRAFANYVKGEDRRGQNLVQSKCSVESQGSVLAARGVQNDALAYVWVFYGPGGGSRMTLEGMPPVGGATLVLPRLRDGLYKVEFWDTYKGRVIREVTARSAGGALRVALPTVQNDLAVKVKPK